MARMSSYQEWQKEHGNVLIKTRPTLLACMKLSRMAERIWHAIKNGEVMGGVFYETINTFTRMASLL